MAHFAQVINGIVQQVIVAEQDFIDSGAVGDPKNWIQTSYNTSNGIHKNGGTPLRGNFAGIGYEYHEDIDAFIYPNPFPSWKLDAKSFCYKAPKNPPKTKLGEQLSWNEEKLDWDIVVIPSSSDSNN